MPDESVVLEITADRVHVEWQGMTLTLAAKEVDELKPMLAEAIFRLATDLPNARRYREHTAQLEKSCVNSGIGTAIGNHGFAAQALSQVPSSLNRY